MALKDSFTAEEWARGVGRADACGDRGDGGGAGRALGRGEGKRGGGGALAGRRPWVGHALIGEIVAAYETSEGRQMARGVLKAEA